MNEKNNFSNLQRFNSAVMAKYEWTSSLMSMQKSGEEIRDRRTKTYRTANKFLQELLQKRSDGSSLDDNGTIDRYHKFLKYKSNFNDDNTLDEFDRRLHALNNNRQNQISKISKSYKKESITSSSQTTKEIIQNLNPKDRTKSLSNLTITSPLNNTNSSVLSNISSEESQINISLNTNEHQLSSSLNQLKTKTLYKPKARRADGSEIIVISTESPLQHASSDVLIFNHCYFPRSLISRKQVNTNTILKKQLPSLPIETYDNNQLFHLLDQIENKCSSNDFTSILDQLTLSTVQTHQIDNNISLISDNEDEEKEDILIIPNLFDQSSLSHDYYTTSIINIDDPRKIFVYTMTIGIVQLSPSLSVPYSILNGRRPLLQYSVHTNFKQIRSKRKKYTSQVTAIESLTNIKHLKENDIIIKINDQSVWHLTTNTIRDILQQHSKQSNNCSLTIVRLCQPFI